MSLGDLVAQLDDKAKAMEHDVFEFPPADWAAFQNRLGQWQGIDSARNLILGIVEDEKQRDDKL